MRRLALILAAAGVVTASVMAGAPAQAQERWMGDTHTRYEHHWREHREWRPTLYRHFDWRYYRHRDYR